MISKNEIKRIRGLHLKKGRKEAGQFIIEGLKSIHEAIASKAAISSLFILESVIHELKDDRAVVISEKDMKQISALASGSPALAVVEMNHAEVAVDSLLSEKIVALDGIRDPGNLGTIIRTADWFGIKTVVLSSDCVDPYNPKALQSTMGSVFNINVVQTDLPALLSQMKDQKPDVEIFAAVLNGEDAKQISRSEKAGVLIIGSESHGISDSVASFCTRRLTIKGSGNAESLNASIAAAILISDWTTS